MNFQLFTFCLLILSVSIFGCNIAGDEEGKKVIYDKEEGVAIADTSDKKADTALAVTEMKFEETEHDFGTINDGVMASHTFKFTNTGKAPLIISDARADCGCTVPSWTKEPVMPGGEGKIDVKYNSSGRGGQEVSKTVTVIANTEPSDNKLTIKAKVRSKGGSPLKK